MIQLNVKLDSLLPHLRDRGWGGMETAWTDLCQTHMLPESVGMGDWFQCDHEPGPDELLLLEDTESFLQSNLEQSIEHIGRWLPEVNEDIRHSLTVVLLPNGKYSYGPKAGLQLFSLETCAAPIEAYLFLVHVYYHELSFLNETPRGRRCAQEQLSAEDFREWIRLLIRNEGIGNYAILEELAEIRDAHSDYVFRYFTYARKIGQPSLLQKAVSILADSFAGVNDDNVAGFRNATNRVFKSEALPIINLVGIHMADSIANCYGVNALKNVYHKDAAEFFAWYCETGAAFAGTLKAL
jgi:hypothetical protein